MEAVEKIRSAIAGKKTYLVAAAAILGVVIAWSAGQVKDFDAVKLIVDAVLAVTIRAGVAKVV